MQRIISELSLYQGNNFVWYTIFGIALTVVMKGKIWNFVLNGVLSVAADSAPQFAQSAKIDDDTVAEWTARCGGEDS